MAAHQFPTILVLIGTWAILAGTVLYWPLARLNYWFAVKMGLAWRARMSRWFEDNPWRRRILRILYIMGGIGCLAFAVAAAF